MKRNLRLRLGTTILASWAGLVSGCSLQQNCAERHYRSHPIMIWPIGQNRIRIDFFDEDGVNRFEVYDSRGRLCGTFSPNTNRLKRYEACLELEDGPYKVIGYDARGKETTKNFAIENGTKISPRDWFCM